MKIVVDKLPTDDIYCLFFTGNDFECPFSGGKCEICHDKYQPNYGQCPYLVEEKRS